MVKEIIWSNRATISFNRVIAYLLEEWTEKEVAKFAAQTDRVLNLIQTEIITPCSSGRKDVFEVLVTKHN